MSNVEVIVILLATVCGWAFGWVAVVRWLVHKYAIHPVFAHLAGCVVGVPSAFGAFALVASAVDHNDGAPRGVLFFIGILLLSPFANVYRLLRKNSNTDLIAQADEPEAGTLPSPASPKVSTAMVPGVVSRSSPHTLVEASRGIELPHTFSFSYRNQQGDYGVRTVKLCGISGNGGHTYLEGFCHERGDTRTFRTDRIRGELTDMETGELIPVKRLLANVHKRSAMTYKPASKSAMQKVREESRQAAVLFTGFSAHRRNELELLADAAGWGVRATVGSTLDYLVTGPRGGPSKVAKAHELGVTVIDEDAFLALIE